MGIHTYIYIYWKVAMSIYAEKRRRASFFPDASKLQCNGSPGELYKNARLFESIRHL